uniref:Uncharacterized protein n=1 Tax=Diadromus pulchellus ascovirus 4a TaxID=158683 RepID=Q9DSX2_9VIRU|nr:hypothetical protein [Diadromus pulchellus ascovirus 4a]
MVVLKYSIAVAVISADAFMPFSSFMVSASPLSLLRRKFRNRSHSERATSASSPTSSSISKPHMRASSLRTAASIFIFDDIKYKNWFNCFRSGRSSSIELAPIGVACRCAACSSHSPTLPPSMRRLRD